MNKQFETIDISGDAGIRAFGNDLPELFVNAGIGMFSLITDLKDIVESKSIDISTEGATPEGLLVSFLNELIFHFDTYGFVGKSIAFSGFQAGPLDGSDECRLTATVAGEEFDPERHEGKLLIKAATYHRLKIEKIGDVWEAEVIFDI
jgi:SHS2 domain-containing protein